MTSREIAERIEEELAKNNLKKKDFHEKTGITRAAFSLWKNEKAFPSKESLDIINQFLGTTFGVSEIEKAPTVETNSERQAEAGVRSVVFALYGPASNMTDQDYQDVLSFIHYKEFEAKKRKEVTK